MSESVVRQEVVGRVLHVVLDRPPANALGAPIIEGLTAVADTLERDDTVKVAVISSAIDGIFAAGADIKQMGTLDPESFAGYRDALRAPVERINRCGKPTIAAIDGLALGGGLELSMACTLRFATAASKVGLPEVKLGLIPGAGGTQRLPLLVGRGRALEIMLSGRSVPGEEALQIGLVDRLVDGDVVAEALAYAETLAAFPVTAMKAIIDCVDAVSGVPADGMQLEGELVVEMLASGEAAEGIAAFIARRPAAYA
ncbi:enoyl-CoA hydratase-related protein [Paraconexibacter sp. AEG42_29]|uniref:enoyl-CoA hydratase/isomerase family protein n=1 Tax=Paraconexibacter sp. AEG42_29 TaxID=2997339 RepID=UPI00339D85AA